MHFAPLMCYTAHIEEAEMHAAPCPIQCPEGRFLAGLLVVGACYSQGQMPQLVKTGHIGCQSARGYFPHRQDSLQTEPGSPFQRSPFPPLSSCHQKQEGDTTFLFARPYHPDLRGCEHRDALLDAGHVNTLLLISQSHDLEESLGSKIQK
jgi:hypothetical protein